jgi:fructose-bisphosphate aldolase class I
MVKVLTDQGIIPGIKVDAGTKPLAGSENEVVTEGLDGLGERLAEYRELGARFAKWRAVIWLKDGPASDYCIEVNAHALARYAALCQREGIVPIVEPEVEMTGTHDIDACYDATKRTLLALYRQLQVQRVHLPGTILKPNMVLSGKEAANRASAEDVARATVECFKETVPAAVPGIAFLSGGQSDEDATVNLNAINRYAAGASVPWQLTYSYGRGLQAAPQKAWSGKKDNVDAAKKAFYHRAMVTSAARQGKYSAAMEK